MRVEGEKRWGKKGGKFKILKNYTCMRSSNQKPSCTIKNETVDGLHSLATHELTIDGMTPQHPCRRAVVYYVSCAQISLFFHIFLYILFSFCFVSFLIISFCPIFFFFFFFFFLKILFSYPSFASRMWQYPLKILC
jgi:hypothetical protein